MKEIKNLFVDDSCALLRDCIVRGSIVPSSKDLEREIVAQGDVVIEGSVHATRILVIRGPFQAQGSVTAQKELSVHSHCRGNVEFQQSVLSPGTVACNSFVCRTYFGADIRAVVVNLKNALVVGDIFADEVELDHSVVLGCVFARKSLRTCDAMVGTFLSPSVDVANELGVLLPCVYSLEPIQCQPKARIRNFSLADLGALLRGDLEKDRSGFIQVNPSKEGVNIFLSDATDHPQAVLSYSVADQLFETEIIHMEQLQNQLLLAAGSIGAQIMHMHETVHGSEKSFSVLAAKTADFFFKILSGAISVKSLRNEASSSSQN